MFRVEINEEKCIRCLLCVELCPSSVFEAGEKLIIDNSKCIGCMGCIPLCPTKAIKVIIEDDALPQVGL